MTAQSTAARGGGDGRVVDVVCKTCSGGATDHAIPRPNTPMPSSAMLAGSGTEFIRGVASKLGRRCCRYISYDLVRAVDARPVETRTAPALSVNLTFIRTVKTLAVIRSIAVMCHILDGYIDRYA